MIRDENGINVYSIKEVSTGAIQKVIASAYTDGVSIISKYKEPCVLVLPLSFVGMKKTNEKMKQLLEQNTEGKEFLEVYKTMYNFLENIKE